MTTAKHFALTLALALFALLANAQAQTPRMATVNITPDADKVHISAIGDVSEMRVEVADEQGEVIFQSGVITGQKLDWKMKDGEGERVAAGTYLVTVTYRNVAGKVKKRVEQITVDEAEKPDAEPAAPEAVQETVTTSNPGVFGSIARFTGPATIANSVITQSTTGRIGIGTAAPAQSLHVLSASSRLRLQSSASDSLTGSEYVTNNRGWLMGAGGSTAEDGVANKFFLLDQTANQYRLAIDAVGNVGIGTPFPQAKLHLRGGDLLSGAAGNEWIFHTRYHAGGDFLHITDLNGSTPQFQRGLVLNELGRVGIGTVTPAAKLDVRGDIRLGPSGQYQATSGDENLRIIRGVVSPEGNIIAGSGFTVSLHSSTIYYTITFNTPFRRPPAVTATAELEVGKYGWAMTDGVTTDYAIIKILDPDIHIVNTAFHFIAIGPR